mgnify:CR=1 FL=1
MKQNTVRRTVFPILAAFIWGTAFVAQSIGAEYVGPLTFNTARSAIASAVLLAVSWIFRRIRRRDFAGEARPDPRYRRELLPGGLCCGCILTVAANLQQLGLKTTTSGKAGFLTAMYIVLVPVFGLFFHKRVAPTIWVSVGLAVAGLYFLCIGEGFSISRGDLYMIACSVCYTVHILAIDHFTRYVDGVELSCAQFLVMTVLSGAGMLLFETPSFSGLHACLGALLYAAVFSSCIAYTLQILAQKDANPTVLSLLLSLESVFAVLAGALVLHDHMSGREYFGCALMLCAVVLAQLPGRRPAGEAASPDLGLKKPDGI